MIQLQNHTSTTRTSQRDPVIGKSQVKNSAGGYVFSIDEWKRLHRFLILGTEGGTYYATEKKLTRENTEHILKLLASDGKKFINTVVQVSDEGLAQKNDYALYALALAISFGDAPTKFLVTEALPKVARTASHLTQFVTYARAFRGWGRALVRAVRSWYENKPAKALAYQMTKYANRNGWTQFDLLNVSHPVTEDAEKNALFRYVTKGDLPENEFVRAFEQAKKATSAKEIADLIRAHRLPQEITQYVRDDLRNDKEIWGAFLDVDMPMTAMIRNLGAMTSYGVLTDTSAGVDKVIARLADLDAIRSARVHPLSIMAAMLTYKSGHGFRGGNSWVPVGRILDALDEAFYLSFEAIEPSNKRISLNLDVSGSMGGGAVGGIVGLTPRIASAVMAMATIRSEPKHAVYGFCDKYVSLADRVGKRMSLNEVVRNISGLPFGRTDCALPMYAAEHMGTEFDAFVIYTDNETWYGNIHPFQALKSYRRRSGIASKLVVCAMTATNFSIADPSDPLSLDIVGLSTDTPAAISAFIKD